MPFTAAEIRTLAGVGQRTLARYADAAIITRPKHRGRRTTYDDLDVARVIAMRDQLGQRVDFLSAKKAVRAMSAEELKGVLERRRAAVASPPAATAAAPAATAAAGAAWRRIPLLPGLELHVAEDASVLVKKVAQEIAAMAAKGPS